MCVILLIFLDNEMWLLNISPMAINSKQWFLLILDHGPFLKRMKAFHFLWREKRLIDINIDGKYLFSKSAGELSKAYDFWKDPIGK